MWCSCRATTRPTLRPPASATLCTWTGRCPTGPRICCSARTVRSRNNSTRWSPGREWRSNGAMTGTGPWGSWSGTRSVRRRWSDEDCTSHCVRLMGIIYIWVEPIEKTHFKHLCRWSVWWSCSQSALASLWSHSPRNGFLDKFERVFGYERVDQLYFNLLPIKFQNNKMHLLEHGKG